MESPAAAPTDAPLDAATRNWKMWWLVFWIVGALALARYKWPAIQWFALGDTDDNMRMSQVRALLHGQGWFDLRQYKLDPPHGASIHWTRLVDLPIAGLILVIKPIFGGRIAEMSAVAIAPMLALGPALMGAMLAVRRLVAKQAFALAAALVFCGQAALLMFMPLRIDHHGWQLAFLLITVAGAADPEQRRGGATAGIATALSLSIGLEMLPYLVLVSGIAVLRWVVDPVQAERMRVHGLALAIGCVAGFGLFASYDNRAMVCDVLSPVWLSAMVAGGALMAALSFVRGGGWMLRLGLAAVGGAVIAGGFAGLFPDCLGRPERLSPEVERLWFVKVREAKPLYQHGFRVWMPVATLPLIGAVGSIWSLWRHRREPERLGAWLIPAVLGIFAALLLLWQTRAGPAAQLLAIPGAAALGWTVLPWCANHRLMLVRVFGTIAAFLTVSGLATTLVLSAIPEPPPTKGRKAVNTATGRCVSLPSLNAIAKLPAATILTFIDLGPRLITVTHHNAIAGPYHRNQAAILDIEHAFRAVDPEVAHDVMRRHGASLLLLCPGYPESTIYASEAPKGFYKQMVNGTVPGWLEPVSLPKGSPFRLWRRVD